MPELPPASGFVAGTKFKVPSDVVGVQACIVIATIACFFAAIVGTADAGMEEGGRAGKGLGVTATVFSFLAFVFSLTAYCVWSQNAMVKGITRVPITVGLPYFQTGVNGSQVLLAALPSFTLWFGSSWGCALVASIILFITWIIHCCSVGDQGEMPYYEDSRPTAVPQANAVPVQSSDIANSAEFKPIVSI